MIYKFRNTDMEVKNFTSKIIHSNSYLERNVFNTVTPIIVLDSTKTKTISIDMMRYPNCKLRIDSNRLM